MLQDVGSCGDAVELFKRAETHNHYSQHVLLHVGHSWTLTTCLTFLVVPNNLHDMTTTGEMYVITNQNETDKSRQDMTVVVCLPCLLASETPTTIISRFGTYIYIKVWNWTGLLTS